MTNAIKVRRLLAKNDIKSSLIKINAEKSQSGCTYGIKISGSDFYNAVVVLKNNGITYSLYSQ